MPTPNQPGEMAVVTKAKELCAYVMTVTQKSPKQFRFTFTSRLQNLALDVIEQIYRANDVMLDGNAQNRARRLEHQHASLTSLRILAYFAMLAREQGCLTPRQYELIANLATDCQRMLGGWINSDRRRQA